MTHLITYSKINHLGVISIRFAMYSSLSLRSRQFRRLIRYLFPGRGALYWQDLI